MLRDRILEPLGLDDSGYDDRTAVIKQMASGYLKLGSEYQRAPYTDASVPYAAGYAFGWLALVMLVLAIVGRLPRSQLLLVVGIIVAFAFQSVFVALRASAPVLAALHPLNGFLILGVATYAAWTSWKARAEAAAPERTSTSATTTSTVDA